jgi:hypothetical protein
MYKAVFRCCAYEFEDVVCGVDEADLLQPRPSRSFAVGQKLANRLARHISINSLNPGIKRQELKGTYDLFFMKCLFPTDLLALNSVTKWKQRCGTSVCWLSEVWAGELHKWKGHLKILSKFDYILLNCSASVQAVQEATQRPCFYIPPGVDTVLFCPYPNPPVRCIDVYYLGRRSRVTHQALLRMAEQKRIFYMYDTIDKLETSHPRQHRSLIANTAKRSHYFIANSGKIDQKSETHGQKEIGFRFLEGAAAGTVMIGEHPDTKAFREHFDWPDAVIHVPFDAPDISEILAELDAQPERLEQARKNNTVQSLLRHDWVYRWKAILDIVGLDPRPALLARQAHLKSLAKECNTI